MRLYLKNEWQRTKQQFGHKEMDTRSTVAHEFRFSLEAGVIDLDEIIQWADGIMATEEYDDRIANICLTSNKTAKDLHSNLAAIASTEDEWNGFRRMLGRMHKSLLREPDRLHDFTRFLERIWIRCDYEIPKDLNFIVGLEDEFQLAEDGHGSYLEVVRANLIGNLARYQTEPGQSAEARH